MEKSSIARWVVICLAIGALLYGFYHLFTYKSTNTISESLDSTESENSNNSMENTSNAMAGLKVTVLQEGSGAMANSGDTVTVNYLGTLADGTKFDSSYDHGTPFSFQLGAGTVIKGWDFGVLGMKVGEKRKLEIPSDLGYGPDGYGLIPGNATLIFEVELLNVN